LTITWGKYKRFYGTPKLLGAKIKRRRKRDEN